jgi:uncharacterized protein YpmS
MKVRPHNSPTQSTAADRDLAVRSFSLGKLQISNEEILDDLRYPAAKRASRR